MSKLDEAVKELEQVCEDTDGSWEEMNLVVSKWISKLNIGHGYALLDIADDILEAHKLKGE